LNIGHYVLQPNVTSLFESKTAESGVVALQAIQKRGTYLAGPLSNPVRYGFPI